MPDFRDALSSGRLVLFDGAMGTEIYRRGVFINRCYDDLVRSAPKMIREIHQEYRDAGAEALETNTFGANRFQLQSHGIEDEVVEVNRAAARLAREVAGDELFVAGSVGPLGIRLEPYGPTSREEARDAFAEQAEALAEGGVDLFMVETFSDVAELREAVAGCRAAAELPIVALVTVQPEGETTYGTSPREFAAVMEEDGGAAAIGLNCSVGPAIMLEAVREMAEATALPIAALPNAGLPKEVQGRKMYLASPEYMASYTRKLVEAGARIVGGCCGTEPRHVREMSRQLKALTEPEPVVSVEGGESRRADREEREAAEPVPLERRSEWGRKVAAGEPVTSVEVQPPRGADAAETLEACRRLREASVDAVSIPDGARASMRMGVLATASLVQERVGLEAIAHYTCRDRNLLGMTSDLLGAQALGIRNLLLLTGDPPKMGPYPEATAVFDIDSIGLTNLVVRLNRGQDLGGSALGSRTSFVVGVGVNPSAVDMDRELRRWYWKVDAGAEYAVTQPIFDPGAIASFLERIEEEELRIPVVAGIWPLASVRDAEFLNHEVPGIEVPEPILERMRAAQAKGPDHARGAGIEIARELLEEVADLADGVQVTAPGGDVSAALEALASLPVPVAPRGAGEEGGPARRSGAGGSPGSG